MTLPASGAISMSQVATELGISATGLNLNDSRVRTLAGIPSGSISLNALHGKSNFPPLSVSAPNTSRTSSAAGTGTLTTTSLATASGGSGGYTYLWQFVSGDTGTTVVSATNNSGAFSRTVTTNDIWNSSWRITVTDSGGRTASATISVTLSGYQM